MTDQENVTSNEAVIDEALGVIDQALAKMIQRELVSSGEVADLLLDVRSLLTTDHEGPAASGHPAPSGEPIEPVVEPVADPA